MICSTAASIAAAAGGAEEIRRRGDAEGLSVLDPATPHRDRLWSGRSPRTLLLRRMRCERSFLLGWRREGRQSGGAAGLACGSSPSLVPEGWEPEVFTPSAHLSRVKEARRDQGLREERFSGGGGGGGGGVDASTVDAVGMAVGGIPATPSCSQSIQELSLAFLEDDVVDRSRDPGFPVLHCRIQSILGDPGRQSIMKHGTTASSSHARDGRNDGLRCDWTGRESHLLLLLWLLCRGGGEGGGRSGEE